MTSTDRAQLAEGLPELPHKVCINPYATNGAMVRGYTAAQMHDYARAAIAAATPPAALDALQEAVNDAFEYLDAGKAEQARRILFGHYDARAALGETHD